MPDEFTIREIDKVAIRTLKEAGMREPPFLVDDLLDHLEIDREFYDLEDPGLIGDLHQFYAESFYNQHDVLTLIVHHKKMHCKL